MSLTSVMSLTAKPWRARRKLWSTRWRKKVIYNKGENISATLNLASFKSLIKTLPRIATCPVWKSLRLTRSFLAPLDLRSQHISRSSWANWACPPSGSSQTASTSQWQWSPTWCSSASGRWRRGKYPPILASHLTEFCTSQDSFEKGRADV